MKAKVKDFVFCLFLLIFTMHNMYYTVNDLFWNKPESHGKV